MPTLASDIEHTKDTHRLREIKDIEKKLLLSISQNSKHALSIVLYKSTPASLE